MNALQPFGIKLNTTMTDPNEFLKTILNSMMDKWTTYFTDFIYLYGMTVILCSGLENEKFIQFAVQKLDPTIYIKYHFCGIEIERKRN